MKRYPTSPRAALRWTPAILVATMIGCAQPIKTPTTRASGSVKPDYDDVGDVIRRDPVSYLESCLDRCKQIDEFTTTFYRQERLGLVPALRPVERILAKWRREPLSIKFEMPDDTSEYAESLYIDGRNKNEIQVLPRRGLLGLPPTVDSFPVKWSLLFHKAKNLITDFGPQRMLERTLFKISLARREKIPGQIIRYKGMVKLATSGQVVHHIQIINPPHRDFPHAKQDLYIDPELQIPAGAHLWTKTGQLDAMYLYAETNPAPHLTDEDFTMKGPSKSPRETKTQPASKPASDTEN